MVVAGFRSIRRAAFCAVSCDCYLFTESHKIRMRNSFLHSVVSTCEAHRFPPPSIDAALLHLTAKVFDSVAFEKTGPLQLLGVWRVLATHRGTASDELIIFVSQILEQSSAHDAIRDRHLLDYRLTLTSLTHWFTPSSLPSTYITPGGPPLRRRTNTSWKVAACLSLATFFREVMWCVRINALWRHCIASGKLNMPWSAVFSLYLLRIYTNSNPRRSSGIKMDRPAGVELDSTTMIASIADASQISP